MDEADYKQISLIVVVVVVITSWIHIGKNQQVSVIENNGVLILIITVTIIAIIAKGAWILF